MLSKAVSPSCDIKAVVLDMDGLIFDTEPLHYEAIQELLEGRGHSFTEELSRQIMGTPGPVAIERIRDAYGLVESADALLTEAQAILNSKLERDLRFMPGVESFLARIEARGLPKAVATSTGRETTDRMLGMFDLHRRFEFIVTSDDVTHGKPHPEIYQLACSRHGIAANFVLVLEDSFNGLQSAKRAGCLCVAVPHALSREFDFSAADLVVDNLSDPRLSEFAGF